jgi:uncharacterized protein (TIGR02145 family)
MRKISFIATIFVVTLSAVFIACKKDKKNPVTGVMLSQNSALMLVDETLTLSVTIEPDDATNNAVNWTSSDPTVATVNDGKITALKIGTTFIIATAQSDNKADTCVVTVTDGSVSGITLSQKVATMYFGDTLYLVATIHPKNAINKRVVWTGGQLTTAQVQRIDSVTGMVTTVFYTGEAMIVVTTEDGAYTDTCRLTVLPVPVSSVTLPQTAVWTVGTSSTLSATVLPANAANKTVSWTSSNPAVATVNSGVITTHTLGTTTITVTTEDGNKTASCAMTVIMTNRCNGDAPGWGVGFGTISRGGETTISGNGITQIWSDAVTTSACNAKSSFSGDRYIGSVQIFNADCRSNPGYPGDYFSWCAVIRFADSLCPAPWRVPTRNDFANLDKALGGSGENRSGAEEQLIWYIGTGPNQWKGAYGGYCWGSGTIFSQGEMAFYWSSTNYADSGPFGNSFPGWAYYLTFSSNGWIQPQYDGFGSSSRKEQGHTLRCVKD